MTNPRSSLAREGRALAKGVAFLSPWIIGFSVFIAIPLGMSFYNSFCHYTMLRRTDAGLDNYRDLAIDPVFWKVLRNTIIYAATALPLGLIFSLGVAMLLNSKVRGVSIYRTLVFLPSLIPIVASAMLWMWLFNAKLGLVNTALRAIGITDPPGWLVDEHWAMPALVLMSLWGVGNTVVIFLAGLQDVPRELYEAAEIDGASLMRKAWHVTIPFISPVIFFNLVMAIIGTFQIFAAPFIITQGGPARATYFFTMYLYDNAFNYVKMGYASAMAWVQFIVVLILTGIALWSSKHWVHYHGK